jgi:hypothetical protein
MTIDPGIHTTWRRTTPRYVPAPPLPGELMLTCIWLFDTPRPHRSFNQENHGRKEKTIDSARTAGPSTRCPLLVM